MLYHAMDYDQFKLVTETNAFHGYSTHRFHPNGTVPWDNQTDEYAESEWFFGLCLTRSKQFATRWKDVVLVLDKTALRHNHKIVPFNWFETRVKSEFEEFLITGRPGFKAKDADYSRMLELEARGKEDEADRVRQNNELLTTGRMGSVKLAHRYIREIRITLNAKQRYASVRLQENAMLGSVKQEQFGKNKDWLNSYCKKFAIPLTVVT